MAGTLTERLQLVVDATTGEAQAEFAKLGDATKTTAATARTSATEVAAAADKVAAARLREQDAAGKVSVAEVRLRELRDSGSAKASQIAAAEERLAAAQRQLQVATNATSRATAEQTAVQATAAAQAGATAAATERVAASNGALAGSYGAVKSAAAGFLALGIVGVLRSTTAAYVEGARGAQLLANSTNATVEQASRLQGLAQGLGLDFNDLLEIEAQFATQAGSLGDIGVQLQKNANGTVNWTTTLEDTLVALQEIPDATERNAAGFKYFGEEGYKQLSALVSSGRSVRQALEQIGTPFTDADVAQAADFSAAMYDFQLTAAETGRELGRNLLPILTDGVELLGGVVDVVTAIPAPLALTTAAAIALGVTGFNPAAAAGARLTAVAAAARVELGILSATMVTGGAAAGVLGAGLSAAGAAGRGVAALAGGPLGLALIAGGAAYYAASVGADQLEESAGRAAKSMLASQQAGEKTAPSLREMAERLRAQAGEWETLAAAARGTQEAYEDQSGLEKAGTGLVAFFSGSNVAAQNYIRATSEGDETTRGFELAIEQAREELGAYGAQQEVAQVTQKTLTDLIAEGATTGTEFAAAVKASADATAAQAATSDLATAAVEAYNAVTRDAVQNALDWVNADLARNDADFAFLDAADKVRAAVDDQKTSVDEVAQAHNDLQKAAVSAAGSAADAAVAAATSNGVVLTDLAEAQLRADTVISDLQTRLNTPGLGDKAKEEIQGIIDRLTTAKDSGNIEATLTTLGLDTAKSEIDGATEDRDTTVTVESRNGPAVISYLEGIADAERLSTIRVETRNGPAVLDYIRSITEAERLGLIRLETRNGPAVDSYIGTLTRDRLAIIRVETRNGPAVDAYLDSLATQTRIAAITARAPASGAAARGPVGLMAAGQYGASAGVIIQQQTVQVVADGAGRPTATSLAEAGRQTVEAIRAYEQRNGARWRRGA